MAESRQNSTLQLVWMIKNIAQKQNSCGMEGWPFLEGVYRLSRHCWSHMEEPVGQFVPEFVSFSLHSRKVEKFAKISILPAPLLVRTSLSFVPSVLTNSFFPIFLQESRGSLFHAGATCEWAAGRRDILSAWGHLWTQTAQSFIMTKLISENLKITSLNH